MSESKLSARKNTHAVVRSSGAAKPRMPELRKICELQRRASLPKRRCSKEYLKISRIPWAFLRSKPVAVVLHRDRSAVSFSPTARPTIRSSDHPGIFANCPMVRTPIAASCALVTGPTPAQARPSLRHATDRVRHNTRVGDPHERGWRGRKKS